MSATLSSYLQQTQRLIGDVRGEINNPADLKVYVNLARAQVAAEGQCVRVLPPSAGGVTQINPGAPGDGYTPSTTTVSLSAPDQPWGTQATAVAIVVGDQVAGYEVTNPGSGYALAPPIVTVSGEGTGATATAAIQPVNVTVADQQEYPFQKVPIWNYPAVKSILAVRSIQIIWTNFRYPTFGVSWTKFNSKYNPYTRGTFLYAPIIICQFGQGDQGSILFSPVPNQAYCMEWDCSGLPVDLVDDTTPEAIPEIWTQAVPFYAAYLALLERVDQRSEQIADRRLAFYRTLMRRARAFSQPSQTQNPYS